MKYKHGKRLSWVREDKCLPISSINDMPGSIYVSSPSYNAIQHIALSFMSNRRRVPQILKNKSSFGHENLIFQTSFLDTLSYISATGDIRDEKY